MASPRRAARANLEGPRIALTGRLAAMTRAQALRAIAASGGRYARSVTRDTALLVVGMEGWPLRRDGRLSRKLQQANRLRSRGGAIEILREDEWLERLGLHDREAAIHRRHTLDQLTRIVGVSGNRIRSWIRAGFLQPAETVHGVPCFAFRQIAAVKRLEELRQAGVTTARLRRSLEQLAAWLPDARDALAQLDLVEGGSRILVRGEDGTLTEAGGQRLFDFAVPPGPVAVRYEPPPPDADELFERAVCLESAARLPEAEAAWRDWLERFGPEPEVCFNLGNVLFKQGRRDAAVERYRQALEIDPDYVEAWSNLGGALAEGGDHSAAAAACRRALEIDPSFAHALFNLADALQEQGLPDQARPWWEAYLRQEPDGPWADHARSCLAAAP